jgi:hypothetical protein
MIYKFKSKAAGDVIMMAPGGDQVLRLIGKEPSAQGILHAADMPAAIQALEKAVAEEEAARKAAADEGNPPAKGDGVSLRQRAWPLVEMMKRAHGAGQDIVWGV